MLTKQELLREVQELTSQGLLTKEELLAVYEQVPSTKTPAVTGSSLGMSDILSFVGGAIVFFGISILLWQNWSSLSSFTKIIATFGSGLAAYIVGLLFHRDAKLQRISTAFYFISALVLPLGLHVVFDTAGWSVGSYSSQSLIAGVLFVTFFLSWLLLRQNVFLLFSILFGTWFFFSFTSFFLENNSYYPDWKFAAYRTLVVGLSYILLGYSFSSNEKKPLTGFLYGFGILFFLGAALALGEWQPSQNIFWELIFVGLLFATFFVSLHIKSRSFLTFGSIFLVLYIWKITSEYFTMGMGWPLSLVIAGLFLVAAGYLNVSLRKKYLK